MKRQRSVTEPGNQQSPRRDLRGEIASLAARLIARDGIVSFAAAKRKALRQMGITAHGSLPDDHEIDAALREYQAIFQGDSQPQECKALRQIAVEAMRWLDRFSPWLVGAVLSGSASRFSPIELEIVANDARQLEMFLYNEGIQFKTHTKRFTQAQRGNTLNNILAYEILFDENPMVIGFYPDHAVRMAHCPRDGLKHARAQLADVELLLAC